MLPQKAIPDTEDKTRLSYVKAQQKLSQPGGLASTIPVVIITLLMFIGAAAQGFWPLTDPARYQCYALTFWLGSNATHMLPSVQCSFLNLSGSHPAFHMLPLEYPPLTLLPFSLPLLAPLAYYQVAFAFLMSLVIIFIYWLMLRYGPPGGAVAFLVFLVIGACALAPMRYDLLPAACTLLGLIMAHQKRWRMAYVMLAIAVLLKIYPILLFPAFFIAEQQSTERIYVPADSSLRGLPSHLYRTLLGCVRWRWSNCLFFFVPLLAVTGFFALLDFQNAVVSQVSYFLHRPIQVESLGGSLLWLAHLGGLNWRIVYDFGSINMYTSLNSLVAPVLTVLFVLAVAYIFWLQWQSRLTLTQTVIALTLAFITTGKVFSPQYLIWLIPLLAYAGAFNKAWTILWGSVSLLTMFIYVAFYSQILNSTHVHMPVGFFEVAFIRNILLALLTLAYLFNWFRTREQQTITPLCPELTPPSFSTPFTPQTPE
ncbi:glycosyltransferase family 87 protein [Dictyobacter halimunensis]